MVTRTILAALAAIWAFGSAGFAQLEIRDDNKLIQGTWIWDNRHEQSDAQPKIDVERIVINGDKLTFHYIMDNQRFETRCQFKINPSASPKKIDFWRVEKPNTGKPYTGLYDIKTGTLRFCYRGPGVSRPKDFDDKKDGNNGTSFIHLVKGP